MEHVEDPYLLMAPAEIYAVLLDRGVYLCSESTMYRLLRRHGEVRERRRQAVHPPRTVPELVAEGPNRVWSCRVAGRNLTQCQQL
ncbi:hypothetical protein [Streptomyces mirabilis]|uniref:hypothetical protein n=1 Tax=Streptomyces mirabilis TaxID=68239 RepID=UPI0037DA4A85